MTTSPVSTEVSPLGVLGFSAPQEQLYRLLLRNSGRSVGELAGLTGLPVDELREQLTRFAGAGLVELEGEDVVARPPQASSSTSSATCCRRSVPTTSRRPRPRGSR
jgi:hypothetical protein